MLSTKYNVIIGANGFPKFNFEGFRRLRVDAIEEKCLSYSFIYGGHIWRKKCLSCKIHTKN